MGAVVRPSQAGADLGFPVLKHGHGVGQAIGWVKRLQHPQISHLPSSSKGMGDGVPGSREPSHAPGMDSHPLSGGPGPGGSTHSLISSVTRACE